MPPSRASSREGAPARSRAVAPAQTGAGAARSQIALAEHIETIGVRKRGYGREGRPVEVSTNHFAVKILGNMIVHYDGQLCPNLFNP
jgi:eukaryotic translation initiation factor 2C